jgi:hypothetical protein
VNDNLCEKFNAARCAKNLTQFLDMNKIKCNPKLHFTVVNVLCTQAKLALLITIVKNLVRGNFSHEKKQKNRTFALKILRK